jgi:hypothetical protein
MKPWAIGRFDLIGMSENLYKLPGGVELRRRSLDLVMKWGIPFNLFLGLRIAALTRGRVEIISPPRKMRQNHVGSAHACAIATIGEFAAGLLIAQNYSSKDYRMIISKLEIEYHYQGKGILSGIALAPATWPAVKGAAESNGCFIDIVSIIRDEKSREIATCKTCWQVKAWDAVRKAI